MMGFFGKEILTICKKNNSAIEYFVALQLTIAITKI